MPPGLNSASGNPLGSVLDKVGGAGRDAIKKAIDVTSLVLVAELKNTLSQPGRGKIRLQPKRIRRMLRSKREGVRAKGLAFAHGNRASRPGDPPAPDTGALRNSIQRELLDGGRRARVGTNLIYAPALEYGTATIKPRPYFRPTIAKVAADLQSRGVFAKIPPRGT